MDACHAADLVEFLERHGLEIYINGGWAVDALLGEQTRPHDDLDLAVPHKDVPRLRELLAARGYVTCPATARGNAPSYSPTPAGARSTCIPIPSMTPATTCMACLTCAST